MDMNDLYLVAVRLSALKFMAEASHINAKKAVRGLAADLQEFHEQGQRSSAAHLMQHGASAVAVAAIEDAQQPCVANDMFLRGMFCTLIEKTDKLYSQLQIIADIKVETDAKIASAEAKIADVQTSADAKIADNKAEADAKIAENKAEADSKIAELQNVMDKVVEKIDLFGPGARAAADGRGAGGPVRKYQRYTAAARKTTLEWMLRHASHPYPTPAELEKLRKETGIDTTKRMSALLVQIRTKDMEKDNTGVWRKRVMQPATSKKGKVWTQKNIKDWI